MKERIYLVDFFKGLMIYPLVVGAVISYSIIVVIIVSPIYMSYLRMKGEPVLNYKMDEMLVDKKMRFKK